MRDAWRSAARLIASLAVLAGCGAERGAIDPSDLAAVSEALGILPSHVDGRVERFSDCRGDVALVVSPSGAIRIPVAPGLHTLRGRYAICAGAKPAVFDVSIERDDGGGRRLLEHEVGGGPQSPADRSHAFMVTFHAEAPASLVLRARGHRAARPGWGDLALHSAPAAGSVPPADSAFEAALGTLPDGVRGLADLTACFDEPTVMVHAPTELRYGLAAGRYRIRARYGICPGAHQESRSPTDGVTFEVAARRGEGLEVLFERRLDPVNRSDDAGLHDLALDADLPGGDLLLRTVPGGHSNSDWSVLADVRIERTDAPSP